MNERILELVNQADIKFDVSSDNYGVDTATVTPYDLEKFAELIVKETMQVVANQLPSNQYLDVAHAVIEHYKDADVT
jgi:hypothetical protein